MRIQIIGRGRMGAALEAELTRAGLDILPVAGREWDPATLNGSGTDALPVDVVLLAVPDAVIAQVAARIAPGPLVGHLSGMTTLDAVRPHDGFSVHPLLPVTGCGTSFVGASAAIAATGPRALAVAKQIAELLGLATFYVADEDRPAYHAAASSAANFLVTLEGFAERLAETAGVPRSALVPLAEAALANWAKGGAASALTGPIVRGDEATVSTQRAAVAERLPQDLALFDALVTATRALADSERIE